MAAYVGSEEHLDTPFTDHEPQGCHLLELGVDKRNPKAFEPTGSALSALMGAAVGRDDRHDGGACKWRAVSSNAQAPSSSLSEQLLEVASVGTCDIVAQSPEDEQIEVTPGESFDCDRRNPAPVAILCGASHSKKLEGSPMKASHTGGAGGNGVHNRAQKGTKGALCSTCTERPGQPGPAVNRTLEVTPQSPTEMHSEEMEPRRKHEQQTGYKQKQDNSFGAQEALDVSAPDESQLPDDKCRVAQCARGKFDGDEDILEDTYMMHLAERTSPGHLRDRLVVLQERASAAIKALPVEFGQIETRIWGLEALKHVLPFKAISCFVGRLRKSQAFHLPLSSWLQTSPCASATKGIDVMPTQC